MKIVLATPLYPPEIGGPATYTKELSEHLKGHCDIAIVAYADSPEVFEGTTLFSVSKRRSRFVRIPLYTWHLWRASRGADLIYVQNAMAAGLPTAIVSAMRGIPFILKFVGDEAWERATRQHQTHKLLEEFLRAPEGNWKIRLVMRIQGFVLRRAAIVTTPSKYLLDELVRAYGVQPDHAIVNYNAAEVPEEIPFPVSPVPHQLLATARLTNWKGVDGIIKATALLKDEFPDVRLVIAGDGPEEENLKELARSEGVSDRVVFLGRVSRAETWKLRKQSEIYVLNSTYEGLPHTALTSFAAQIPMVATDISGTNEAVYDGKTGLLIEPGDTTALAAAIARLFKDKKLQQTLVANGTQLLKDKFSWEAHLEVLERLFQTVAAKPRD